MLNRFVIEEALELTPGFIRKHAPLIPLLFQASLLNDLEVQLERVPDLFLNYIERITRYDTALLYVWEPEDMWFCRGLQGDIPDAVEQGNVFTLLIRNVGKPLLVPDMTALADVKPPLEFSSMIGLPIFIDTKTIGCVELYRKSGAPFERDDINLIKQLLLYSEKVLREAFSPEKSFDDALDIRTDVPRRYVLLDILHQYVEQAKRLGYPLSVAIVDIQDPQGIGLYDDMPAVIRTLQALSRDICDGLRCYDKVLRYEEKSFFAILPGCVSSEAALALEHARRRLAPDLAERLATGIASLPAEAQDAKGLINAAHQALSHAVREGLATATFIQTAHPVNLSMELDIIQIMRAGPTIDRLNALLKLLCTQCQCGAVVAGPAGPGRAVSWDGRPLGALAGQDMPGEVLEWITTTLAPAWAVAAHRNSDLEDWHQGLLLTASILADMRAGCPMGYSMRVADQLYSLARDMGLADDGALIWAHTALAANLGYLGMPGSVFTKEDLNPFDRTKIQLHPIISGRIVKNAAMVDFDQALLMAHHENIDGSGYPRGLKGAAIPEGARALRVVDTYHALTTPRLYRPALLPDQALQALQDMTPDILDRDITGRYVRLIGS